MKQISSRKGLNEDNIWTRLRWSLGHSSNCKRRKQWLQSMQNVFGSFGSRDGCIRQHLKATAENSGDARVSSPSLSAAAFEDVSPVPRVLVGLSADKLWQESSRVDKRVGRRQEHRFRREWLPLTMDSSCSDGGVTVSGNENEYDKAYGGCHCNSNCNYNSNDWLKCHKCRAWYDDSCCGGEGKKCLVCKSCLWIGKSASYKLGKQCVSVTGT
jgi:hypothetical protein